MACGVRLGCAAAATPGHARQRRSAECGFCQSRRNGRAAEAHAEAFEASVWQRGALTPCRAPRAADRLWPVAVRKVDQHRAAEPAGQGAAGPGGDAGGARAHHRLPAQGPAQAPEVSARAEPPPLWAAPVCARLVPCVAPGARVAAPRRDGAAGRDCTFRQLPELLSCGRDCGRRTKRWSASGRLCCRDACCCVHAWSAPRAPASLPSCGGPSGAGVEPAGAQMRLLR